MWTNKFKEYCEDLVIEKQLKSMKNYSTTSDVHFLLTELPDGISCNTDTLKLGTTLYTSNMVMFNEKNFLKKYDSLDAIINNFCNVRYEFYVKRKAYQVKNIEDEIQHLQNKERFVKAVINEEILIMNVPEETIIEQLTNENYDEEPKSGGYDYLLRMQVRTFTLDKVEQLEKDISNLQDKLNTLKTTTEKQIWIQELDELEKHYTPWITMMANRVPKKKAKSKK
jgi:DNA topoisomerase-2